MIKLNRTTLAALAFTVIGAAALPAHADKPVKPGNGIGNVSLGNCSVTDLSANATACLGYAWALAEGVAADPVLDANLQAALAGRLPVGLIAGSVIAYAQVEEELARLAVDFRVKREAREARR